MTNQQTNQRTNYKEIIDLADENWKHAEHCKISNLNVEVEAKNYLQVKFGRRGRKRYSKHWDSSHPEFKKSLQA